MGRDLLYLSQPNWDCYTVQVLGFEGSFIMGLSILQVDAFTDVTFMGNPAAVCVLSSAQEEQWMQRVAQEMNLSETAFLHPQGEGYSLRWFTPTVEVDLCGHATLASAHVLWMEGHLPVNQEAHFYTRSGVLTATRQGEWIELNFPETLCETTIAPPDLLESLGLTTAVYVGKNRFDYLVEIESDATLHDLKPDFQRLRTIPARGIIVTSVSSRAEFDFVSRFFAPGSGIDEDPVTGSAHCCLGPYWRDRLGKDKFLAYQDSARGGVVKVECRGDRILLQGQAVTVLRGELFA